MKEVPLKVYKASAGSGKTFTLAVEYIKLLVNDPESYRTILAVTFTNKATEEMKQRIVSQLHGLANGYADSRDYLQKITDELHVDEAFVRSRARLALRSLVHHYTYFRVETIDKFFQRVLRNLARELDLTANLRIELRDKEVEALAVDTMIDSLGSRDVVLGWIMEYILQTIDDNKRWNILDQVKLFGQNIFKDAYKEERSRLIDILTRPRFFDDYKRRLWQMEKEHQAAIAHYAATFQEATNGLDVKDFYQGNRGVYAFFNKLEAAPLTPPNSYVLSALEAPECWASKSPRRPTVTALAATQLLPLLRSVLESQHIARSATLTRQHLDQLRLLHSIEEKVREMNSDANRFLLSDTQGMLHSLIDDSDTPFIFEKIGAPLRHIMIDEFQDTGTVQWKNFKVLLSDVMHQGTRNLIVGDVKQSIYRWRSGDWRLLNNITGEFGHNQEMVQVERLDTNYRSSRAVVTFNNHFFLTASRLEYERLLRYVGEEAEQLRKAYSDVAQALPPWRGPGGYVHVELLPKKDYKEVVLERVADTIHDLLAHGIRQRDIAILARSNSEIELTADYFQKNVADVRIISDEAFRLDSSLSVGTLITALRVLLDPSDVLSRFTLAKTYQNAILHRDLPDPVLALSHPLSDKATAYSDWLPEGFRTAEEHALLRSLPLTDVVERLYNLFQLHLVPGQEAYVCTFHDCLCEHLLESTSDISRFLQAWDDTYHKKTIHGDEVDGVRMVTIHKSKGLEYDNLILPFCNWQLERTTDTIIWCHTDEPPFNELPLLPIDYGSKKMLGTAYEGSYLHEHLQNSVDNLNLLYVAFTRAKSRLFVYGEKKSKNAKEGPTHSGRSRLIELALPLLLHPVEATLPDGSATSFPALEATLTTTDEATTLDYGQCFDEAAAVHQEKSQSENIFLRSEESETFALQSHKSRAQFRQSNASLAFTESEGDARRSRYIERGTLLHHIFSRLRTVDDLEQVLQQLEQDGVLYDETSPEELRRLLERALKSPQVREWFSPHWTLHNECPILFRDAKGRPVELRPDRVMSDGHRTIVVDFKFGAPRHEHHTQVSRYMEQLALMGHTAVEGYLWYVSRNKIMTVTP